MRLNKYLLVIVLSFNVTFGQQKCPSNDNIDFIPGELIVRLEGNYFDFPLEAYATYVSFDTNEIIKMDSIVINHIRPGTNIIESEKIVNYKKLSFEHEMIFNKIKINFNKNIISLFKRYGVYYIARGIKSFSPQDTLSHYIQTRRKGRVLISRPNYNKSLIIKFKNKSKTKEFAEELRKIKGIKEVQLHQKVIEFFIPNDTWYKNDNSEIEQRDYMGQSVMNFEGAWDIVKGDHDPYNIISIGIIDSDFDNIYDVTDLDGNINGNGPYFYGGSGTGHGVAVASVACAETNNNYLISGATHNSKFMPFLWTDIPSIRNALQTILNYQDDEDYDNDCFVVNMSFGYSNPDNEILTLCNELYNDWGVLLVAAVSDISGGSTNIVYPAGHNSVIGVGASKKSDDELLEDSNYGDDVEVVATGESIFYLQQWFDDWDLRSGTSVAAPFVSSLCALILSTEEGWQLSNDAIRQDIINNADQINDHGKTFYRINAQRTLDDVTPIFDEIVISGPVVLDPLNNYTFYAAFYDYPPSNYIVGNWNWELKAKLTDNFEIWDSGNTTGSSFTSWNCTVPSYDPNMNWVRDRDGRVIAYITVSAQDNEGNWHYDEFQVGVNDPPPPPPLSVNITGPTFLGYNELGYFTANPSGGSGTYINYRWWSRDDDGFIPEKTSSDDYEADKDDNTIRRPPPNVWIEMTQWEGEQNISKSSPVDFSLKCEVTDSYNNTATDIHSVNVGRGLVKEQNDAGEISMVAIPEKVELTGNYPNPFNPNTTIRFGLPDADKVLLQVFNVNGQLIGTLIDGYLEPGYHDINFNGQRLSSGIYLYKLSTADFSAVKRVLIVK